MKHLYFIFLIHAVRTGGCPPTWVERMPSGIIPHGARSTWVERMPSGVIPDGALVHVGRTDAVRRYPGRRPGPRGSKGRRHALSRSVDLSVPSPWGSARPQPLGPNRSQGGRTGGRQGTDKLCPPALREKKTRRTFRPRPTWRTMLTL